MQGVVHRFSVGEEVRLLRRASGPRGPQGTCVVEELLPVIGHQPVYKVRDIRRDGATMVAEADLVAVLAPATPQGPAH